jgi:hypothetical protein
MSYPQTSWDEAALTTSMMMISLDENAASSRERTGSTGTLSSMVQQQRKNSMTGWGNQTSRQTYRHDLCSLNSSLHQAAVPMDHQQEPRPTAPPANTSQWNYFDFDMEWRDSKLPLNLTLVRARDPFFALSAFFRACYPPSERQATKACILYPIAYTVRYKTSPRCLIT